MIRTIKCTDNNSVVYASVRHIETVEPLDNEREQDGPSLIIMASGRKLSCRTSAAEINHRINSPAALAGRVGYSGPANRGK